MVRLVGAALATAVLAGLLQLVSILVAPPASASCAPISDTRLLWDADAVFAGEVFTIHRDAWKTTFTVRRVYKGDVGSSATVVVPGRWNPNIVSSITLDFRDARWWLVFADERGDELVAFGCAGTRPLPTKIPAVLGTGYPPTTHRWIRPGFREPEPQCRRTSANEQECVIYDYDKSANLAPWLAAAGVALLILAGPGLLWVRRARRRRANVDEAEEPRIRFVQD